IVDDADLFGGAVKDQANFYFSFSDRDLEELRKMEQPTFDGILHIPSDINLNSAEVSLDFYTTKNLNIDKLSNLKSIIQSEIRDYKLKQLNITERQLSELATRVAIESVDMDPDIAPTESTAVKSSEFSSYLGA